MPPTAPILSSRPRGGIALGQGSFPHAIPDRDAVAGPLQALGLLDRREAGKTESVRSGLRRFQMLTELKPDGVARRGGPTEIKLAHAASGVRGWSPAMRLAQARLQLASSSSGGAPRPTSHWNNPAEWALREAGRALGGDREAKKPRPGRPDASTAQPEPPDHWHDSETETMEAKGAPDRKWSRVIERPKARPHPYQTDYHVRGPVKVRMQSWNVLALSDGTIYQVQWFPLGPDGKPSTDFDEPAWRKKFEKQENEPHGGNYNFEGSREKVFSPPFEHPHGWRFRVVRKPQPEYNGNSGGIDLYLHVPEDEGAPQRSR